MDSTPVPFPGKLPSQFEFYDKFDLGAKKYADVCMSSVDGTLGSISDTDLKSIIQGAWYYMCVMYNGRSSVQNTVPCSFLYFWIGSKLFENPAETNFKHILFNICKSINNIYGNEECKEICDLIDGNVLKQRKIIFDFWYDYDSIQTLLEHSGPGGYEKYQSFLQGVRTAYSAVEGSCTNKGPYDYCKKFWPKNSKHIHDKLSQLETEISTAQGRIVSEAQLANSKLNEAVRNAKTTSSITSIFGTLAATAFPFFLYKYKPWSSWFGNHTFGNGGGRRSTRRKRSTTRNLDTFTENSSTYDSTTESTIADSTAEDSTTLRSAAYSAQPRGRTNNAGGRGMCSSFCVIKISQEKFFPLYFDLLANF
ncbi:KIR protein [Plasmodium coatneyi]|uniref:KIR protein n=1 Tax=Plasmodium coatneyi TaxID=208452 RepID=A0A1B1E608_9APIC|nr:KIR protein [Plasmodium coatneyi]ANQ10407.1 KIR protein [Plasmodium coatneyi]